MGAVQTQVDPLLSALEEQSRFDNKKHGFSDISAWNKATCQLHGAFMVMREKKMTYILKIYLFYNRALLDVQSNMQMHEKLIPSHFLMCN